MSNIRQPGTTDIAVSSAGRTPKHAAPTRGRSDTRHGHRRSGTCSRDNRRHRRGSSAAKSGTRRRKSLSDKQLAILEAIQQFGGDPRLPAEHARDRRRGRALLAVERHAPARPARAERLPAPRPEPAAGAGDPHRRAAPSRMPSPARHLRGRIPVGDAAMVPLVGRIAAGIPITAEQQIDEVFPLPRQLVGKGELFMLKVVGDSMIDAAICDGDWIVVRQQKHGGERRHRRGDARRGGHGQGVPAARRPHLAAPAQHELSRRSWATTPRCWARSSRCCGRCSRGRDYPRQRLPDCRAPRNPAVAPRAAR